MLWRIKCSDQYIYIFDKYANAKAHREANARKLENINVKPRKHGKYRKYSSNIRNKWRGIKYVCRENVKRYIESAFYRDIIKFISIMTVLAAVESLRRQDGSIVKYIVSPKHAVVLWSEPVHRSLFNQKRMAK